MKKNFLVIFTTLYLFSCNAQELKQIDKSKPEVNQFIGNVLHFQTNELKNHVVKTFILTSKLAIERNETDEYKNDIYISICTFGELLECKLYSLEGLIKIKVEGISQDKDIVFLKISHGNYKSRELKTIKIKID